MKIDDLNQKSAVAYVVGVRTDKPEAADPQGDTAAKQQSTGDKVDLSTYMPVVPSSRTPEGIRAARIQELKAQVASGSYEVPSTAVAEKMVNKFSWS